MGRTISYLAAGIGLTKSSAVASLLLCFALAAVSSAFGETNLLDTFATPDSVPPAPWQVIGLPHQTKPYTHFAVVDVDGRRALRVEADKAYGNLVHLLELPNSRHTLSWQWRIELLNTAADLRQKNTDDTTLKVCVFFDLSLKKIPFFERQILRVARASSPVHLPGATMCYVWDPKLPEGTTLPNAFSGQVRYIVAATSDAQDVKWRSVSRDVTADFLQLFGDETHRVPPIVGIGIGADSDNTNQKSVGYVADLMMDARSSTDATQ
jgi:Protein of unknown function (DUF3047)